MVHPALFPCPPPQVLTLNLHHSLLPGLCEEFWDGNNEQTWGQSSGPQHILALIGHNWEEKSHSDPYLDRNIFSWFLVVPTVLSRDVYA